MIELVPAIAPVEETEVTTALRFARIGNPLIAPVDCQLFDQRNAPLDDVVSAVVQIDTNGPVMLGVARINGRTELYYLTSLAFTAVRAADKDGLPAFASEEENA